MKFDILSEDEIVSKICELNPNFKMKTTILSTNNENEPKSDAKKDNIKKEPANEPNANANANGYFKADTDLDLKDKIEQLKRVKQEQERQFRTQQAQMQAEHRHQQQEHEKQLKLKLQSNSSAIQLQLNLSLKQQQKQQQLQHQQNARFQQQQHQQKLKTDLIEAKRIEKCLQRERKTREKWFEYIMSREQQSAQLLPADSEAHTRPFEPIDDMQEKHLKPMPELKQLHVSEERTVSLPLPANLDVTSLALDWLGDSLQVVEFLSTFGEKLKESIEGESCESAAGASAQAQSDEVAVFQFSSMISSIDSFRCGLENKSEKLRKETTYLIQFLLKAAINNTNSSSAELDNSSSSTSTDAAFSSDLGNYIILN